MNNIQNQFHKVSVHEHCGMGHVMASKDVSKQEWEGKSCVDRVSPDMPVVSEVLTSDIGSKWWGD